MIFYSIHTHSRSRSRSRPAAGTPAAGTASRRRHGPSQCGDHVAMSRPAALTSRPQSIQKRIAAAKTRGQAPGW